MIDSCIPKFIFNLMLMFVSIGNIGVVSFSTITNLLKSNSSNVFTFNSKGFFVISIVLRINISAKTKVRKQPNLLTLNSTK